MKNIRTLREDLILAYEQFRAKEIGIEEIKNLANMSGKIISNAKAQLEYNKYAGSKQKIDFFEDGN